MLDATGCGSCEDKASSTLPTQTKTKILAITSNNFSVVLTTCHLTSISILCLKKRCLSYLSGTAHYVMQKSLNLLQNFTNEDISAADMAQKLQAQRLKALLRNAAD